MRIFSTLSAAFWTLVLGIIAMFAFFLALGAVKPSEVTGVTFAVGGLLVLWLAHATWVTRRRTGDRDMENARARERRGF